MKSLPVCFTLALLAPSCASPSEREASSKAEVIAADLRVLETTVKFYAAEFRELPESWADLIEGEYPFLERIPLDPWGNEYSIESAADMNQLTLGSYGRDNQPGGTGEDADAEVAVRFGQGIGER